MIHSLLIRKQILNLCNAKEDFKKKVHSIIDKFAERGLRSLAVASQVCDSNLNLFILFFVLYVAISVENLPSY